MHAAPSFAPGDGGSQGSTRGPGRTKSWGKKKKKKPRSCSEKQRALHCCREQPRRWCLKHTEFIMEPPLSIQSPCSAQPTSTINAGTCTTKCVFCVSKDIAERGVQPYWLTKWWMISRVVQRAKDKFGWSRYFYFLAHCRIAPVQQCILGNERQVTRIAN